jgi:hypothetical protein
MRADIHALFDAYRFTILGSGEIVVCEEYRHHPYLGAFHGKIRKTDANQDALFTHNLCYWQKENEHAPNVSTKRYDEDFPCTGVTAANGTALTTTHEPVRSGGLLPLEQALESEFEDGSEAPK